MIKSLLDTDFYTFTMMQGIFHRYTAAEAEFEFKWRNWDLMNLKISMDDFIGRLKKHVNALCELQFTTDELAYLYDIPFMKPDFVEYLRLFKLNRGHVRISNEDGMLAIRIRGPLLNLICFEEPLLAMISELYTKNCGEIAFNWQQKGKELLNAKLDFIESQLHRDMDFKFADFGTRRRAGFEWHDFILKTILERCPHRLTGTSNVYFAKKYGINYIGTMAHLWVQIHQQLGPRLVDSQSAALQAWADEYRGELGIALSDTLGFDAFLVDFDRYFALLFDGCRHDSGNPIVWCDKLIHHYRHLRIDPKTKTAVFSDGLTFDTAVALYEMFCGRIQTSFGIGTYLTNDCGFRAPQIVIKNTKVNGNPTAKISDSPGKGMCKDESFLDYLKGVITNKVERRV